MTDRDTTRKLTRDGRGQMPFSLIAVVLIMISSLSAVVVADIHDKADQVGLTIGELERMEELSSETRQEMDNLAFQAILDCCSGGTVNESRMIDSFRSRLFASLNNSYPLSRGNYRIEVNASGMRLAFLRLPLSDEGGEENWQGQFMPAYVGLTGSFQVKVIAEGGNLTRDFATADSVKVPWPFLKDRMEAFNSAIGDELSDLNVMVRGMLDSLAAYRTLQGWGMSSSPMGKGVHELITPGDVVNALDLGLMLLQYSIFRNVTPCLGMSTGHMDPQQSWDFVRGHLVAGGSLDPVDIYLGLYGYDELDWRKVFSQTLYAAMDRLALRWMEHFHLIDPVNIAEHWAETAVFTLNDIVDIGTGIDLAEGHFKDWLEDRFEGAGLPDTLYRYLCAASPENTIIVPSNDIELVDGDGHSVVLAAQGLVAMDFPTVDVLAWSGWGEFHEQYRRGTKEILNSMCQSLGVMAESISLNMFVPAQGLVLDPTDGLSFLDEIRSVLDNALERKEEWLRPAITAAERYVTSLDPLAEATKSVFLEERETILERSHSLEVVIRSVSQQILDEIQAAHSEVQLPPEENLIRIEQAMFNDPDWTMMDQIISTYESHASFLTGHFLDGLDYRPTLSGHPESFLVDIIVETGDHLVGLGVIISDDVRSLISEMTHGLMMRGSLSEVFIPKDDHFRLLDQTGRVYREYLKVEVEYPSSNDIERDMQVILYDPGSYDGNGERYPQLHDTDILKCKWASFQSVWGLVCTGRVDTTISPGGEIGQMLPLEMRKVILIDLSQTISVVTGQPLAGVNYLNINTLFENMAKVLDNILRPLRNGIETISSGLQTIYRTLENTVKRLLEMGTKVLETLSEMMQELLVRVQHFVRTAVLGLASSAIEAMTKIMGEKIYCLSLFGLSMTIKLNPKELLFPEAGTPVSFILDLRAGECAISVTSRLFKMNNDLGFMTNATMTGKDWSVYLVIDPFMDIFQHMVELRGIVRGSCIELAMPEVVSYNQISFALSDIPGVGALLSSIPLPLPGLKGSVDAGVYVKVLTGRSDAVLINEFELNPPGEDAGNEWVELYNPTSQVVNLAGWSIQTTHGIQAVDSLKDAVLMPKGRLIYYFPGQALDNQGKGFPSEESIVLRDDLGRRVDSTPFATDYWNDERTWQRAQDGADRWEFREGTKGRSNGWDPFTLLDLDPLQQAFVSAVTESIFQFSSSPPTMESLSQTLTSTMLHLIQRLTAEMRGREVEMGMFIEVSMNDYSSAGKVGVRMELSLRCGTLGSQLDRLAYVVPAMINGFGNPFQTATVDRLSDRDVWITVSSFCSIGIPKMISVPGTDLQVQYATSLGANLATLSALFGQKESGWGVEGGVAICGVPSNALPMLRGPTGSTMDLWLCKAKVHEAWA